MTQNSPATLPPSLAIHTTRANGLDTLRAIAIALVFMYHYMVFVSRETTFGWLSTVGWVGVDLFFVLSGYLIANQIFSGLAKGHQLSLPAFYARRALRTLPVFWVVLALYFAFPTVMGGKAPPPLWTFLTFTQNINLQPGTAFSHAWSLCIEEQFYVLLPLVLVAGIRLRGSVAQGWFLLAVLLALGIVARGILWQQFGREAGGKIGGYHPNIYYATLCRFDEFLPGVAVAMVKNFHAPLWAKMMQYGQRWLAAGVLATLAMLTLVFNVYYIDDYGYGFFMTTFGYSLIACAFAVLVVAALSPDTWLYRARIPGAYPLALWSYSIYLSHKAIAFVVQQQLQPIAPSSALLVAVVTVASAFGGWLLFRFVETPFMNIRNRRFPTSFSGDYSRPSLAAF